MRECDEARHEQRLRVLSSFDRGDRRAPESAPNYDIRSADAARFTNNHAWALVRPQQNGLIQKLAPKSYIIAEQGLAWLRQAAPVRAHPVDPPAVGAMPLWANRLVYRARLRNGPDGPPFTEQDLMALWDECNGRCRITRLEFSDEKVGRGQAKRAYAPSLDRINPRSPIPSPTAASSWSPSISPSTPG